MSKIVSITFDTIIATSHRVDLAKYQETIKKKYPNKEFKFYYYYSKTSNDAIQENPIYIVGGENSKQDEIEELQKELLRMELPKLS